jgi:hypothetical protein
MRAAAHNPKFAKKMGIPKRVAEDFVTADMMHPMLAKAKPAVAKPKVKRPQKGRKT